MPENNKYSISTNNYMTGTVMPEEPINMSIAIIISASIGGIAVLMILVMVLFAIAYSVRAKGIQEVSLLISNDKMIFMQ